MDCCADWEPQTKIVNGHITLAAIRAGRPSMFQDQGGIPFRFCPWCGRNREDFERYVKMKQSELESKDLLSIALNT